MYSLSSNTARPAIGFEPGHVADIVKLKIDFTYNQAMQWHCAKLPFQSQPEQIGVPAPYVRVL